MCLRARLGRNRLLEQSDPTIGQAPEASQDAGSGEVAQAPKNSGGGPVFMDGGGPAGDGGG